MNWFQSCFPPAPSASFFSFTCLIDLMPTTCASPPFPHLHCLDHPWTSGWRALQWFGFGLSPCSACQVGFDLFIFLDVNPLTCLWCAAGSVPRSFLYFGHNSHSPNLDIYFYDFLMLGRFNYSPNIFFLISASSWHWSWLDNLSKTWLHNINSHVIYDINPRLFWTGDTISSPSHIWGSLWRHHNLIKYQP